jgi:hypothetical protein
MAKNMAPRERALFFLLLVSPALGGTTGGKWEFDIPADNAALHDGWFDCNPRTSAAVPRPARQAASESGFALFPHIPGFANLGMPAFDPRQEDDVERAYPGMGETCDYKCGMDNRVSPA